MDFCQSSIWNANERIPIEKFRWTTKKNNERKVKSLILEFLLFSIHLWWLWTICTWRSMLMDFILLKMSLKIEEKALDRKQKENLLSKVRFWFVSATKKSMWKQMKIFHQTVWSKMIKRFGFWFNSFSLCFRRIFLITKNQFSRFSISASRFNKFSSSPVVTDLKLI